MAATLFLTVCLLAGAANCLLNDDSTRVRRADDPQPLEAVVEQLSQRVAQLEAQVGTNTHNIDEMQHTVGFTVRMTQYDIHGLGNRQVVKFDNVIFNAGNGYSATTGVFTVPRTGTYVLMLETMRHGSTSEKIMLDIMKNGAVIAIAHAGFSDYENGSSGLYVVHLNQGDELQVEVQAGTEFIGQWFTVFSGFRLSP